jgi:hypothetical protein
LAKTAAQSIQGTTGQEFSQTVTGLSPNTTYIYEACAKPNVGVGVTVCGKRESFITTGAP